MNNREEIRQPTQYRDPNPRRHIVVDPAFNRPIITTSQPLYNESQVLEMKKNAGNFIILFGMCTF
jgi:hypothetical protein